jgi:hypothetical protein
LALENFEPVACLWASRVAVVSVGGKRQSYALGVFSRGAVRSVVFFGLLQKKLLDWLHLAGVVVTPE